MGNVISAIILCIMIWAFATDSIYLDKLLFIFMGYNFGWFAKGL